MVWRILAAMRRSLQNTRMKKTSRVADEGMFGDAAAAAEIIERRSRGFSAAYGLYRAAASALACFSHPRVSGTDGFWASGEFARMSEMNHLMVNDSMRYAILM